LTFFASTSGALFVFVPYCNVQERGDDTVGRCLEYRSLMAYLNVGAGLTANCCSRIELSEISTVEIAETLHTHKHRQQQKGTTSIYEKAERKNSSCLMEGGNEHTFEVKVATKPTAQQLMNSPTKPHSMIPVKHFNPCHMYIRYNIFVR
jgi:hypothetical protein